MMKTSLKLLLCYLVALITTIFLAIIDSDPMIGYFSIVKDILLMSLLIWGLGIGLVAFIYGLKILVLKKSI